MTGSTTAHARTQCVFPHRAFDFVRGGLAFTAQRIHGDISADERTSRHVSGKQLCEGLAAYAIERYGRLARFVLSGWNIKGTHDFGVIVFALIDMQVLASNENDSIEDFSNVFDFAEIFAEPGALARH